MINIFLGFCVCHNRLPMASTFVYTCFEEFCLLCGEMKKDGIISINSKEAVQLGLNDELLRVTGIKFDKAFICNGPCTDFLKSISEIMNQLTSNLLKSLEKNTLYWAKSYFVV